MDYKKFAHKKWSRNLTVKVINMVCGRVDVHRNLHYDDILWIAANPNLEIEFLEEE